MTSVRRQTPDRSVAAGLVARTVELTDPPDLLDVAGRDGLLWRDEQGGLAAHGVALRLELPDGLADRDAVSRVGQVLRAIRAQDEVGLAGCGPVAIGALAFDPTAPGSLVIPRRIVGRLDGRGWLTTIRPDTGGPETTGGPDIGGLDTTAGPDIGGATQREPDESGGSPDEFTLTPSMPHSAWKALVGAAVERIASGDLTKVVLARRIDIAANRPFIIRDLLDRLVALYPSCMIFSVDGFIGASPELLISRAGDRVTSHPLAGTVARSGDTHADEGLVAGLMASPKARNEHQLVVNALRDALAEVCAEMEIPDRPSVMGLRNVSHLATRITARLQPGLAPSALDLVARLHPTPAVGGDPPVTARRYLQQVEGFDRGRYAGPVGWVDARGDGAWALGIRSAEVSGAHACIFAGNGIVAGSDPSDELAETQLKLQALLAAVVRP